MVAKHYWTVCIYKDLLYKPSNILILFMYYSLIFWCQGNISNFCLRFLVKVFDLIFFLYFFSFISLKTIFNNNKITEIDRYRHRVRVLNVECVCVFKCLSVISGLTGFSQRGSDSKSFKHCLQETNQVSIWLNKSNHLCLFYLTRTKLFVIKGVLFLLYSRAVVSLQGWSWLVWLWCFVQLQI